MLTSFYKLFFSPHSISTSFLPSERTRHLHRFRRLTVATKTNAFLFIPSRSVVLRLKFSLADALLFWRPLQLHPPSSDCPQHFPAQDSSILEAPRCIQQLYTSFLSTKLLCFCASIFEMKVFCIFHFLFKKQALLSS